MNLTIVVDDSMVMVDGKPHQVDCTQLQGIHAIQWNGSSGWIEYKPTSSGMLPNQPITSIAPYQRLIDLWTAVDTAPPSPPKRPGT